MKISMISGVLFLIGAQAHAQTPLPAEKITSLNWLSGEWVGQSYASEDAPVQGYASIHFTPVNLASFAMTFRWTMPDTNHVHYAFTVFQETDAGILGKGIHYGPDFETFEDAPWHFETVDISENRVTFGCVENCRANAVTFKLLADGRLEERWKPLNETAPDFVVIYSRT